MTASAALPHYEPTQRGLSLMPEGKGQKAPTPNADIDTALAELAAHKEAWDALDIGARIQLLDRVIKDTLAASGGWAEAGKAVRQLIPSTASDGEEYIAGPWPTIRCARLLRDTLKQIQRTGTVKAGGVRTLDDGQVAVKVFPANIFDTLLFTGYEAEIWMDPAVTRQSLEETVAPHYRGKRREPKVALVLGAGNVSSITCADVFHKLFVENQVVVLKMNPVNDYAGEYIEQSLRALIDGGFLRVVYGGGAVGGYLTEHELVEEMHMTGSDKTHDAIVFGPGADGERRKSNKETINDREFSCELGNITPIIVVPGPWGAKAFAEQGEAIASQLTANVGFNCVTGRVIFNHRGWEGREKLIDSVSYALEKSPQRFPYYPGTRDRYERFVAAHPQAKKIGDDNDGKVPFTLIPDVDAKNPDDIAFHVEAFGPIMCETQIDGDSVAEYIDNAVAYCNEHLWGTLAAHIIIHPKSRRDPAVEAALQRALKNLRYGTVVINTWAGLSFLLMQTSWGAFPGHDHFDIQSGRGWVHNTFMYDKPQKTVLSGPFHPMTKPAWYPSHKTALKLARTLTRFEAKPSLLGLPKLTVLALGG